MKLSGTDIRALVAIGVGGVVSLGLFGPWHLTELLTESETVVTTTWDATPITIRTESEVVVEARARAAASAAEPAQPLVYVNGVRISNDVSEIDPDAIDRVEVLKGTAATTLYGDEASGGVIQIFLKDDAVFEPGR